MLSVWVVWMIFSVFYVCWTVYFYCYFCAFFFRVILVARECSCVIFSDFFFSSLRSLFKLFNYFFQGGWKRRKNWTGRMRWCERVEFPSYKVGDFFNYFFFINGVLCSENWPFEEIIIGRRFCSSREVDGKLILLQTNHVLRNKMMRRTYSTDETR